MLKNAIPASVQDDGSKKEVLSKFFSTVFTHEPPGEWKIPELDITDPIKDLEITEHLVKEQLDSLNTSKPPGPDDVQPKLLIEKKRFPDSNSNKNNK